MVVWMVVDSVSIKTGKDQGKPSPAENLLENTDASTSSLLLSISADVRSAK